MYTEYEKKVANPKNKQNVTKYNKKYLIIAIVIFFILIAIVVGMSYAFLANNYTAEDATVNFTSTAECVDISINDGENRSAVELEYDYPITDEYAVGGGLKPITVTVTNNCKTTQPAVPYILVLSSLVKSGTYSVDDKIRMQVKRSLAGAQETVIKTPGYLANTPQVSEATKVKIIEELVEEFNPGSLGFSDTNEYIIDTATLATGKTNTYKIYLWVDYYEGDSQVYSGSPHSSSYDNLTVGISFNGVITVLSNISG